MVWKVRFSDRAIKALSKMDEPLKVHIFGYIKHKVAHAEDPRMLGKALRGDLSGLWRYRIGKYRVICRLEFQMMMISVLIIDKRDKVYASDFNSSTFH